MAPPSSVQHDRASSVRGIGRVRVMYVTAAAITIIAVAVVAARAGSSGARPMSGADSTAGLVLPSTAVPAASPLPSSPTAPAGGGSGHDHDGPVLYTAGPSTPAQSEAVHVIARFAAAWAQPRLTTAAWLDGIRPWTAPAFAVRLGGVDPATIPATTLTGPPTVTAARADLVTATVPTNGGTLTVAAATIDGRWLVTGNDFTRRTP